MCRVVAGYGCPANAYGFVGGFIANEAWQCKSLVQSGQAALEIGRIWNMLASPDFFSQATAMDFRDKGQTSHTVIKSRSIYQFGEIYDGAASFRVQMGLMTDVLRCGASHFIHMRPK